MLRTKTALGIDISDGRIKLAMLKKCANGIELVKAASGPVPDGAIKNGNIEDPIALAKAIKALKTANKISARHAALSLVANPVLIQILDMPQNMPGSMGQFVRNEVKHCAILPIRNVAVDFCGLNSTAKSGGRRVFVVATDNQKVADTVRVLNQTSLSVDAIEPASVAYVRACHANKIGQKDDRNLLFAIVNDAVSTLCLFRNQTLDFIRTKRLEAGKGEPDKCCQSLVEDINAVIRFYDLEVSDNIDKWEVTLVTSICDKSSIEEKMELLGTKIEGVELQARTPEDAYLDTPVADTDHDEKPSAVAVGLAMKLLGFQGCGLNVNLLPPETEEVKAAKKQTLIIANIAAFILLLMIMSVGFFSLETKKVNESIKQTEQTQSGRNTRALLNEQALLNTKITNITENLNSMDTILSADTFLKWGRILNDIKRAIPKANRITELSSFDKSRMKLKGQALSYEAIHLFVETLNACSNIESASLIGTEKDGESGGFVNYSISCSLIQ